MNHYKLIAGIFLLALAGCTGRAPGTEGAEPVTGLVGGGVTVEQGVASVPDSAPASVEVRSPVTQIPSPLVQLLPDIPANDLPAKLPAALTEFWRNGNEPYLDLKSPNAIVNGTTMELASIDGNPAWVVYQIPNLLAMTEIIELRLELSAQVFGGADPGYWIGIANYQKGNWQVMAKIQSTNNAYSLSIPASDPYISPADNFYMFVMLTGTQSLTIDRVGLEYNTPAWVEVIVDADTADGANTGWMPSIVFDNLNNPMVAYAELTTGKPRFAVGDRAAGLGNPDNWTITWIDQTPEDSGEALPDTGAKVKWPDITIDEFNGMPRVSMIYDEITGKEENSRAGISVMLTDGRWLNFRLGWIDGAEWTSIDSIPGTPVYGIATSAKNVNYGVLRYPYDFTYITFDIGNIEHVYDLYRGFGEDWRFPHLRYDPTDGAGVVSVFGSTGYKESFSPTEWNSFFGDPNSNDFGSMAVNPVTDLFGSTYAQTNINRQDLIYVEYDAAFVGNGEIVDSLLTPNGVERIGDVSQLAYLPDGTPVIAYTVFDGNFVEIKYADKSSGVWESQVVSSERSLVELSTDRFVVDLAIDAAGVPAICYRHRDTEGNNSLRVVFNEG